MRYYLHFVVRDLPISDEDGAEFANVAAAVAEIKLAAREMLAEAIRYNDDSFPQSMSVIDGAGLVVFDARIATMMSPAFMAEFAKAA